MLEDLIYLIADAIESFIGFILDHFYTAKRLGQYGEKLTVRKLNLVRLSGRKGKILKNIYVPTDEGGTSEIDVIFITQKGIFVIESKNYSGWIFGDEESFYWTAMLPNKEKNRFYNPIKQNDIHLKWLSMFLQEDIPLYSLIVFSERCELKKITVHNTKKQVIKRNRLFATICDIWKDAEDTLSNEKVEEIYNHLKNLTNVEEAVKTAHVANINEKYRKTDQNTAVEKLQNVFLCPKCGGQLVLRTARKGSKAGSQFYGCSNFPKCKYIQAYLREAEDGE